MRQIVRSLAGAGAALVALALASTASAAFTPRLDVQNPRKTVGGGGPVTLGVTIPREDDATFRIVFYVPQGYTGDFAKSPGTAVGTVQGTVNARAISPEAIVPVTGTVVAADPAPLRTNPSAIGCTTGVGGPTFSAVLLLNVSAAGQTLPVPVYVFPITTGPEAAFASAKLVVCFGNPNVPEAQGGARLGIKPVQASITLTGVFANPSAPGVFRWRALFTPWGATAPNAAGTVESQSIDALPAQLTLRARANRRTNHVTLSGSVTENRAGVGGASVQLLSGRTAQRLRPVVSTRTNSQGHFARTFRLARNGRYFFRARVVVPTRQAPCEATFAALGIQCIGATRGGFTMLSSVVRVTV